MTKAQIRPLRRDDLRAAQALIGELDLFPPDLLPDMAAPFLDAATSEVWLIADDGAGLAYVAPERLTDGTWNLLLLGVGPARQSQGLGRALIAGALEFLRAADARLLMVETSGLDAFSGARAFYHRLGFAEEARVRDYYQAGDDKVIFTLPLRP
jgi:ribosomal protein S18 acetylase RimI-like enzyme